MVLREEGSSCAVGGGNTATSLGVVSSLDCSLYNHTTHGYFVQYCFFSECSVAYYKHSKSTKLNASLCLRCQRRETHTTEVVSLRPVNVDREIVRESSRP